MSLLINHMSNDQRREGIVKVIDVGTEQHNGTTYLTFSVAGSIGEVLYDETWYGIAYKHFKDSNVWFSVSLGYNTTSANDVLPPAKIEALFDTPRNEVPPSFSFTARNTSTDDLAALSAIAIEVRAMLSDCHITDQFGKLIHVRDNHDCERGEHGKAIKS